MKTKNSNPLVSTIVKALHLLLLVTFAQTSQAAVESTTYIITDHLGSPILATDEDGQVKWQEDYQPYGTQIIREDTDNTVGFTGHRDDKALDVTYMQGRWYHPEMGRFMAIDPVGFVEGSPQSFNRYAYVSNNPYRYIDPDGRWAEDLLIGIPSIIVGAHSFSENVARGNYGDAAIDTGGMIVDVLASATPGIPGGAGLGIKATREVSKKLSAKSASKLQRYDGPKPSYHVNPAHVPGQRGFSPRKTPLPNDAEVVFSKAVPNDPKTPTAWFGKNEDGQIYRYSLGNDGTAHFSGIDGVGDGVKNLTKYARDRLDGL